MPAAPSSPPFLLLGRILRPHGVRGELRLEVITAYPDRIVPETVLYVGPDPEDVHAAEPYHVDNVRKHQQYLILHFEGVEDRDAADMLRNQYVMVALEDAVPLEEDEFYLYQIIGLSVYTVDNEFLGEVRDVIETGANDVYVIQGPRGEVLIPATDEFVIDVNIEDQKVTVQLMDGLLGD